MSANFKNVTPLSIQKNRESWLTKDRFWNFVFWLGMSGGFSFGTYLINVQKEPVLSAIFMWFTLITVPLVTKFFCATTFIKDDLFIASENRVISVNDIPSIMAIVPSTIIIFILAGLILDKFKMDDTLGTSLMYSIIFSVPSLFFIVKNCPITILFNRKLWEMLSRNIPKRTSNIRKDTFTDPSYSFLSHNIFHKKR